MHARNLCFRQYNCNVRALSMSQQAALCPPARACTLMYEAVFLTSVNEHKVIKIVGAGMKRGTTITHTHTMAKTACFSY